MCAEVQKNFPVTNSFRIYQAVSPGSYVLCVCVYASLTSKYSTRKVGVTWINHMTEVTNHVPRAWLPRCETQSQSYKSDKKKTQTGTSSFTVRESYGECYIYCFMNAMHRFFFLFVT